MNSHRPLARTEGVLTELLDGELLVYDLDGDVASHLNHTAALVWQACDGTRTITDLQRILSDELGESVDADVVLMALDSLFEHGLLSSGYTERGGAEVALSRRRFFRRYGVGGAIAIAAPVVYSLAVPAAAAAASTPTGTTGNTGFNDLNNQFLNNGRSSGRSYP